MVPQAGHGPKMAKANGVKKINLENVGSPSKIHEKTSNQAVLSVWPLSKGCVPTLAICWRQ